ncbi:Isopentenyl-diphosphate delta-isomerase [archaeon HR06]|nr:Isopentenyl-diphosphate delta-isomerase [archaeon HR06]
MRPLKLDHPFQEPLHGRFKKFHLELFNWMDREDINIIMKRKEEGIKIPLEKNVQAKEGTNYFEYVKLIHNALPELEFDEISTEVEFLGRRFSTPIMIDSMTGGSELSAKINENLALAAEELNIPMGVGSQRAGLKSDLLAETYSIVRKRAPNAYIMANIGGAQLAKGFSIEDAKKIIDMIKANALIIHLNPLQELIQPEGDTNFKGVLDKIREFTKALDVPIIVKEVGAGISREVAIKLELAGVAAINVSGYGGTSWAGVEQLRAEAAKVKDKADLGLLFWDWGIPTAAALLEVCNSVKVPVIASGGIRNGLEIGKSLVLGATMSALAYPFLKLALESKEAVIEKVKSLTLELKATMFLLGVKEVSKMKHVRYILLGPLAEWARSLKGKWI